MKTIENIAIMRVGNTTTISFTYNVIDGDGSIIKSNIRKSKQLKETDTELLEASDIIRRHLEKEENQ